jgi:YHYH protein
MNLKNRSALMKISVAMLVLFQWLVFGCLKIHAAADPLIDSWFTTYSGKYARIYATDTDKNSGNAVSTWSRGTISQSIPARCGVYFVGSSASWVYIRSTGLGSHVMGPWYLNAAHSMLFPNVPKNTATLYRIPRTTTVPSAKTLTGLGAIGYFVDGVAMFDTRDAFYWNGTSEVNGSGNWNRDAFVNESVTFDSGQGHQPGDGTHHYHANPIALRYLLGDHVEFNPVTRTYSEATNPVAKHSPIVGWVRDGYPIYGPYGYSNPTNPATGARRMISGYVVRNGQYGTQNLSVTGRTNIPPWAVRLYKVAAGQVIGPNVSSTYPLGRYMEDRDYLGDLGYSQGADFDLDEYNGRFCVTPEFPGGTYAYFVSIGSNGVPAFPYNIGRAFYGNPTGGSVASIAETVTTNFVGGSNSVLRINAPAVEKNSGDVTLKWSSVEGGTYVVAAASEFQNWTTNILSAITATGISTAATNAAAATSNPSRFYRVLRTALDSSAN